VSAVLAGGPHLYGDRRMGPRPTGFAASPGSESVVARQVRPTFRRTLQAVNADALDRVVSSWLTQRAAATAATAVAAEPVTASVAAAPAPAATPAAGETMRAIAVEGKSARASMGRRPICLRRSTKPAPSCSAQTEVDGKTNDHRIHRVHPAAGPARPGQQGGTADALHRPRRAPLTRRLLARKGRLAARTQPDRVPDGGTRGRAQPASSPTPSRRSERVIASLVEPALSRPTS
jgi:hypothetical protein